MGKGGQERRQAAVAKFGVLADHGLSSEEATMRLQRYRPNELERHAPRSVWKLVLEQFEDTLVRILLPVAVVSFVLALCDDTEGGEIGVTAAGSAVFYRNCLFPPDCIRQFRGRVSHVHPMKSKWTLNINQQF